MIPARAAGATGAIRRFVDFRHQAAAQTWRGLRLAPANGYDIAALLLFVILIVLVALTYGHYAISNDEEVQQRYGELIVSYYRSGLTDDALFHFRNLYLYGGLFDVAAVGLERLLPLDTYAVRHLLSALIGVGGIGAVWLTARAIGGSRAALFAAAGLAACGTWYGAMFNHTKDVPFAAAMMAALYVLLRLARDLPRPRWHLVVLFGVACGCALGIRVLGLFLLAYALLAVVASAPIGKGASWRDVVWFALRAAPRLTVACLIAYVIMIAAWPWAALAPLNPLRGLFAFVDFHYPIQTMLAGHVYHMADVPRTYVPTYVAIKLTLVLLIGAALALVLPFVPQNPAADSRWRRETALVAAAAFLPLLCEVVVGGPAFTGLRHFMFTLLPIAVLAGLGFDALLRRLDALNWMAAATGTAVIVLGLAYDAATLYRLHPDEYLFFNPLVGGLAGASRSYATDYWVNIMPEAVGDLERFLDRTERPSGARRHYLVMVCGERLPFEREADARLSWTRDRDRADFFIAPTHMNCDRAVDGRIVATVERLGVVIGVVKDRRAMIHANLAASADAGTPQKATR